MTTPLWTEGVDCFGATNKDWLNLQEIRVVRQLWWQCRSSIMRMTDKGTDWQRSMTDEGHWLMKVWAMKAWLMKADAWWRPDAWWRLDWRRPDAWQRPRWGRLMPGEGLIDCWRKKLSGEPLLDNTRKAWEICFTPVQIRSQGVHGRASQFDLQLTRET
jgi:hypothetical protein